MAKMRFCLQVNGELKLSSPSKAEAKLPLNLEHTYSGDEAF
ncbi:uncharacterized protein G2W53_028862 [Senna tora]|uniref:Uncharacterized protein n=1 Tax=Senna tora TaxID=362788 RepID=A0A834WB63_9FABA|nr:uncharacterized protein G2W53_028862 [Senna tora]